MKQDLWIVTELFYPDETSTAYILTEIANIMTSKYNVHVICGPEVYDKNKARDLKSGITLDASICLHRTEEFYFEKNNLLGKVLRVFLISFFLFRLAKNNIKSEDRVLIVTNPALLIVLMSRLKRKLGFDLTILVHDVFPENTRPAQLDIPIVFYMILKRIFDKAYSRADMLIVLGRDMKTVMENKVVRYSKRHRIEIIENWANVEDIQILDRGDPQLRLPKDKIVLEYAGNIGRVQGLKELLIIIKEINNKGIEFSFWGTGAQENKMKQFVAENNLVNITFNGAYTRSQQNLVLNSCDIAIVTLAKGMYGLGVPSKIYNILASGKPVLFIGNLDSEIGLLLKENNIGYSFESSDKYGIMAFFDSLTLDKLKTLTMMGENARNLAEKVYSKQSILKKFTDII